MSGEHQPSKDRLCTVCNTRESSHVQTVVGLKCPPFTAFFTPCTHPNTLGWVSVSSDGKASGKSYCQLCGEEFTW